LCSGPCLTPATARSAVAVNSYTVDVTHEVFFVALVCFVIFAMAPSGAINVVPSWRRFRAEGPAPAKPA
jgi:hypothetical protein